MKSTGNVEVLEKMFDPKKEGPQLEDMPESFNGRELIKWLNGKTQQFTVDRAKLKELNESGRLLPDVGMTRYSRVEVLEYYLETKPRKKG